MPDPNDREETKDAEQGDSLTYFESELNDALERSIEEQVEGDHQD